MDPKRDNETQFELSEYLGVLLRRRWIILSITIMVTGLATVYTFNKTPIYQSSALLVIEKDRGGGGVYKEGSVVENTQADYYQTQYRLLKSHTLLEKVYTEVDLANQLEFRGEDGVEKLSRAIKIAPVRRSRLVNILADSTNPKLASRIANSLAKNFVTQSLNNQLFISKDILRTLKSNPETEEGKFAYESLPAVVNNQLIQTLKLDLAKQQAEIADISQRYTNRHPTMVSLRSNMVALKREINDETQKIVQSLKTELSGKLKGNNVRIVDLARIPKRPYKPKKRQTMMLGMLVGLFLGFLAGLAVDILDQTIRTLEDVQSKLGLPSLGMIPFLQTNDTEEVYSTLTSPKLSLTSEAFRNMRTMIDLSGVSDESRSFLVTSAVQEEGKTYISTNLSVAFSQLGGKVLLIDGDMRRPKIHKNFRLTSQHGLSEFLAGKKSVEDLKELVQATLVPNLDVLVCGPRPPNPSELLNTPRVGALLKWAEQHYDRIIVDCPPMFPINDTLLWGQKIQSAAFVVRYGKTRAPLIQNANKNLNENNVKIMGIAVNAAKSSGLTYSSYGHYYQQYYHQYEEGKEKSTPA